MATAVPMTVVALEANDVAVEVTTDCMPPMSFISRDCTSPPLVRVKKPSDWRCRWREDRRPQAVHDPLADGRGQPGLDDAEHGGEHGDGEHAADRPQQQRHVLPGIASSMTSRIRNGVASETTEEATIRATTTASWPR